AVAADGRRRPARRGGRRVGGVADQDVGAVGPVVQVDVVRPVGGDGRGQQVGGVAGEGDPVAVAADDRPAAGPEQVEGGAARGLRVVGGVADQGVGVGLGVVEEDVVLAVGVGLAIDQVVGRAGVDEVVAVVADRDRVEVGGRPEELGGAAADRGRV